MTPDARRVQRLVAAGAYLMFARHLPWSPRPGGAIARKIRGFLAGWMLDECGDNVNIEHGAWFGSGKGVRVGDRADIGLDALVMGPVTIGNDVMMGPRCILLAGRHRTSDHRVPMNSQGFEADLPITVEDDVWIGAATVVLPGRTIGRGSIVGAGAVVSSDIPPFSVAVGNPAKVVRSRLDAAGGERPGHPHPSDVGPSPVP